jgi:hypothetical protein
MLANVAPDLSSRAARTEADAHWCIMSAMSNTDTANFPPFDCAHVSCDDRSFPLDWISVDSRNPSRDSNPAHFVGLASPHCSNNRRKADNSKLLSEVKPALYTLSDTQKALPCTLKCPNGLARSLRLLRLLAADTK